MDLVTERRAAVAELERAAPADVPALVAAATVGRDLGVIGAPHVDVVELNLALDAEFGVTRGG